MGLVIDPDRVVDRTELQRPFVSAEAVCATFSRVLLSAGRGRTASPSIQPAPALAPVSHTTPEQSVLLSNFIIKSERYAVS